MKGLAVSRLRAGYGTKVVVADVNITVNPEQTLVLMGPSGCGKTTLLLTILGIIKPTHGAITLNGKNITSMPIESRKIGYVPQDYGLFPHLNVLDNVAYGPYVQGIQKEERKAITKRMLAFVKLQGFEQRKVHELSGGERQRVALARALATNPQLLLLDEPLSNIDQVTKNEVARELKKIIGGLKLPTIIVTHNREEALFFAQKLAMMIKGKIQQTGSPKSILQRPANNTIKKLLQPSLRL